MEVKASGNNVLSLSGCLDQHVKLEAPDSDTFANNADGPKIDAKGLVPGETMHIKQEVDTEEYSVSDVGCTIKTDPSVATGQWERVWIKAEVSESSLASSVTQSLGQSCEIKQEVDRLACTPLEIKTEVTEEEQGECEINIDNHLLYKCESSILNVEGYESEDNVRTTQAEYHVVNQQCGCPIQCEDHSKCIHDKADEPYKCNKCPYSSRYRENVASHMKHIHDPNAEVYRCNQCNYTTKYKSSIVKHMTHIHDPNCEMYKCKECSYITKYKYCVTKHMKQVHDPNSLSYRCKECPYATKFKGSFTRHMRLLHRPSVEIYKCKQCNFTNPSKDHYDDHVRMVHGSIDEGYKCYASDGKVYNCDGCDYVGADESALRDHLKANRLPNAEEFLCVRCNYATKIRRHLRFHISSIHGPPADVYKCASCDFESKHKGHLLLHRMAKEKCSKSGF